MKITGTSGTRALAVIAKASPSGWSAGMTRSTSNRSILGCPADLAQSRRRARLSDHAEPCLGEVVIDHPTDGRDHLRPEGLSACVPRLGESEPPRSAGQLHRVRSANSRPVRRRSCDCGRTGLPRLPAATGNGSMPWRTRSVWPRWPAAPARTGWPPGGPKRCRQPWSLQRSKAEANVCVCDPSGHRAAKPRPRNRRRLKA